MAELNGQGDSEREQVLNHHFVGERVTLCRFETCDLVYKGGVPPNFVRCDFAAPRFVFEGAAQSTIQLMSVIYNGIDERIIEKTFDEIRKGFGNG